MEIDDIWDDDEDRAAFIGVPLLDYTTEELEDMAEQDRADESAENGQFGVGA